jgi:hypothetical protein
MGALRSAGIGALVGLAAALTLTYLPALLAGTGTYESTDALFVFTAVLVPLGAGAGALWTAIRRPGRTAGAPRTALAVGAFAVLVALLWQMFAVLTGAPRLF